MSKTPDTFYRIYGSMASVCLIPIYEGAKVSQEHGAYFYGDEQVYPSKAAAWHSVMDDIRAEIAERERLLEAVSLACRKDEDRAKVVS